MTQASLSVPQAHRLNLLRVALTGAVTLVVLFVICWVGALIVPLPTHMFISLFTAQPVTSAAALAEGVCWSAVFGAVTGLLVVLSYRSFGFLERH